MLTIKKVYLPPDQHRGRGLEKAHRGLLLEASLRPRQQSGHFLEIKLVSAGTTEDWFGRQAAPTSDECDVMGFRKSICLTPLNTCL